MSDIPDLYADGFSLSAGQFGCTLTLSRSMPTGEPGAHIEPTEPVARIRFSQALGQAMAEALGQMLQAARQAGQQTSTTIKH